MSRRRPLPGDYDVANSTDDQLSYRIERRLPDGWSVLATSFRGYMAAENCATSFNKSSGYDTRIISTQVKERVMTVVMFNKEEQA